MHKIQSCLKRLKEVCVSFLELHFPEVHFPPTLSNDSQDNGMGNGRLDVQALVVQSFQLFVVLLCGVHLKSGTKVAQGTDSVGARGKS